MGKQKLYGETYRGHLITVSPAEYATDPYDLGDYMPPMIMEGGRKFISKDYCDLGLMLRTAVRYYLHEDQQRELAKSAPFNIEDGADLAGQVVNLLLNAGPHQKLDLYEAVAKMLEWPYLRTTSRGSSQGDQVEVLMCWTPQWRTLTGVEPENIMANDMQDFRECLDEWSSWMWGEAIEGMITGPLLTQELETYYPRHFQFDDTTILQDARNYVDEAYKLKEEQQGLPRVQEPRLVRDGEVAIIVATQYGRGWSSQLPASEERMLFDAEIAAMLLDGKDREAFIAASRKYGVLVNKKDGLTVHWMPKGQKFTIKAFMGLETIVTTQEMFTV